MLCMPPHQDAFASKNTVTENIAAENTVTSRVIALLEKRLSVSPVKTTDNLLRLGASSIDMIRLANDLEKAFGQRPKINELTRLESVSALIALYQKAEPDVENTAKASGWTSYLKRTPLLDDVDARALYKKSRYQLRNDLNNGVELPDIPLDTLTIEQRRSRRQFSKQPISLTQFTALLNGVASRCVWPACLCFCGCHVSGSNVFLYCRGGSGGAGTGTLLLPASYPSTASD